MTQQGFQRVVDIFALIVVISIAIVAAPVTWRALGLDDGRLPLTPTTVAPATPQVDLTPLKNFAPFGRLVAAPGVSGASTTAGLQLRGVMLTRPASDSVAMISALGGPAKGFTIGQMLPGGAILDAVEYDLVVVRLGGQLVTLALPVHQGPASAGNQAVSPSGASNPTGMSPASAGPIEQYRDCAQDPLSLLGSLGATAGPDGYRIGATPSEDLKRAGLLPGDVVEKVNGEAIGNPARDRALFDAAVVAGRMRVDIVRDGKHIALSFPLH